MADFVRLFECKGSRSDTHDHHDFTFDCLDFYYFSPKKSFACEQTKQARIYPRYISSPRISSIPQYLLQVGLFFSPQQSVLTHISKVIIYKSCDELSLLVQCIESFRYKTIYLQHYFCLFYKSQNFSRSNILKLTIAIFIYHQLIESTIQVVVHSAGQSLDFNLSYMNNLAVI